MSRMLKALQQLAARGAWNPTEQAGSPPETRETTTLQTRIELPAKEPEPAAAAVSQEPPKAKPVEAAVDSPASFNPAPAFHDAYQSWPTESPAEMRTPGSNPGSYQETDSQAAGRSPRDPAKSEPELISEVESLLSEALETVSPTEPDREWIKPRPASRRPEPSESSPPVEPAEPVESIEPVAAAPEQTPTQSTPPESTPTVCDKAPANETPAEEEISASEPTPMEEAAEDEEWPTSDASYSPTKHDPAVRLRFDEHLFPAPQEPSKFEKEAACEQIDQAIARPYRELTSSLLEKVAAPHASLAFVSPERETHLAPTLARVAIDAAQRERGKVLLIDGDLNEKRLSQGFGVAGQLGLAEVLKETELWHQVIRPSYTRGLYLMPAGRAFFGGGSERAALGKLLCQLKKQWPLVLVLAGSAEDALAENLCAASDHTCLLVRLGETSTDAAVEAAATLRQSGASLTGCVATNAAAL